jgi:hypothetical protein
VEGLRAEDHLQALARLDEALHLRPDLVRWEDANPAWRNEIKRWGILVYEHA